MSMSLLEIQPRTLKFIVELKKQSSCTVRLTNPTDHYVAFKVKTTSPKKYCVRPNVGTVNPKSFCEFTVIMQALKEAPSDMVCKDKFLIQSTTVPEGTTDEEITASMFSKEEGRHVEENKLRVSVVFSPPDSPVLSPVSGTLKQGQSYEDSLLKDRVFSQPESVGPIQMDSEVAGQPKIVSHEPLEPIMNAADDKELKPAKRAEWQKNNFVKLAEDFSLVTDAKPANADNDKDLKPAKRAEWQKTNFVKLAEDISPVSDVKPAKDLIDGVEVKSTRDMDVNEVMERKDADDEECQMKKPVVFTEDIRSPNEIKPVDADKNITNNKEFSPSKKSELESLKAVEELKLVKDVEEMKMKLNSLESKLKEADTTISKLLEERTVSFEQRQNLQQELAELRTTKVIKQVHVGFPLLFVCAVAFISIILGYRLHP